MQAGRTKLTARSRWLLLPAVLGLAACATMPNGPSMLVLPGTGKSFEQFRFDDNDCRQFASAQIGGATPQQAADESGVRSAALGTAVGAVAGAAIGGQQGAAVGAGTGLLFGGLAGTSTSYSSAWTLQQRYDYGYEQCMYSKGHKVPVSGNFATQSAPQPRRTYTPPPSSNAPPQEIVTPPANYSPMVPPPPPAK
jgi:hypothetical protein